MKFLKSAVFCFLIAGLTGTVRADYIMGPTEVNTITKRIQKSRQVQNDPASSAHEKQEAVFDAGIQGYTLMRLINAEINSHGDLQQKLIDFAIDRCGQMGVQIKYSAKKSVYLYDFKDFETYMKIAPKGEHAPDVLFAFMEKAFLEGEAGEKSVAALLEQIQHKKDFLKQYPEFGRRADLEMFLTLDYYELYALYSEKNDAKKSEEFKRLTMEQCRHIIKAYPDTDAASSAQDLLIRLEI